MEPKVYSVCCTFLSEHVSNLKYEILSTQELRAVEFMQWIECELKKKQKTNKTKKKNEH